MGFIEKIRIVCEKRFNSHCVFCNKFAAKLEFGQAAHIISLAGSDGPRHYSQVNNGNTKLARRDATAKYNTLDNSLWMCANCHILIDKKKYRDAYQEEYLKYVRDFKKISNNLPLVHNDNYRAVYSDNFSLIKQIKNRIEINNFIIKTIKDTWTRFTIDEESVIDVTNDPYIPDYKFFEYFSTCISYINSENIIIKYNTLEKLTYAYCCRIGSGVRNDLMVQYDNLTYKLKEYFVLINMTLNDIALYIDGDDSDSREAIKSYDINDLFTLDKLLDIIKCNNIY
jgi:hypothetical protein